MEIKPLPLFLALCGLIGIALLIDVVNGSGKADPPRTKTTYSPAPAAPAPAPQSTAPPLIDESKESDAARAQARCTGCGCDDISISVFADNFIKEKLRSPSTADFASDWQLKRNYLGRMTYTSYVDSQNGFGATVRTNFTVMLLCIGDTPYITDHLLH